MYSNYESSYPMMNMSSQSSFSPMMSDSMGIRSQSSSYPYYSYNSSSNSDRIVGGFIGPFILGGITGGLLAPAFYPRPYYYPYPYYGPYYR